MIKEDKKQTNIEFECEGCADHVCNDECGCELSEAAQKSKNRDKK